ncbi:zeta toxin family protein [Candidatus Dojkabacteria bacterium]|uniref:Zeta toxin family protein n=1 Tax=Candidatus Dojkabacteria bacterium TaxID=2099670 RepID=A0A955RK47_9BACT|nr:zeta toxin family protein [Candidatus Dojkabacteria bacterium]
MSSSKNIFILRGAPASGKGTISQQLLDTVNGKAAYIELDMFRWGIHLQNRQVEDVSVVEHLLAYKNYLSVLENYLENGSYTIVTEGTFSWSKDGEHGVAKNIIELSNNYDYNVCSVLLYADFEILWKRNLERDYSVPENEFRDLYEYVMSEESEDDIKINVGELSPHQTVEKILNYLT